MINIKKKERKNPQAAFTHLPWPCCWSTGAARFCCSLVYFSQCKLFIERRGSPCGQWLKRGRRRSNSVFSQFLSHTRRGDERVLTHDCGVLSDACIAQSCTQLNFKHCLHTCPATVKLLSGLKVLCFATKETRNINKEDPVTWIFKMYVCITYIHISACIDIQVYTCTDIKML